MLKKFFALSLMFLGLCGCSEKTTVEPMLADISFVAEIKYDDNDFTADATISQDALNLVVTSPKEIKGFTLNISKNSTTAEFNGVKFDFDTNSLPYGAIAQVLCDVFDDIDTSNSAVVSGEENCVVDGRVNGYDYSFCFSPSGLPLSLQIDDIDLKINFKNVTIK